MVASQDPRSVPTLLIELSTHMMLHKFNSPAWLKHVQKANAALDALTRAKRDTLETGEAYVWSRGSTDDRFTRGGGEGAWSPTRNAPRRRYGRRRSSPRATKSDMG